MSDDHDVVRGDSSSSISTSEGFEKVAGAGASENSSRDSPMSGSNSDAEHSEAGTSDLIQSVEDKSLNEQFFSAVHSRRAVTYLIIFTAAMFVLPLLTMYATYHYIFREYYHFPKDQAMLYAGLCGIGVVITIVVIFVYIAYHEEREDEKVKNKLKKSQ